MTPLSERASRPQPRDTARAMSQENVEIVRSPYSGWNDRGG